MARIDLEAVSKVYGGSVRAVNDLPLDIADGLQLRSLHYFDTGQAIGRTGA
jgi:hypothetical protein